MRIGRLRHKITIERPSKVQDGAGGVLSDVWEHVCSIMAEIKPLNGNEKYVSHEKYATATHQILTRYNPYIAPVMRVRFGKRVFDIKSCLNIDERNKMLQLIVEEEVNYDR